MHFSNLSTWWNCQPQYKQDCVQGIVTGATIGVGVTTFVNAVEIIKARQKNEYTPKSFSKNFYRKTFKGLRGAVVDSTIKNIALFGTIPLFQRITNTYFPHPDTSYLISAICSSALFSISSHSLQAFKYQILQKQTKVQRIANKTLPKHNHVSLVLEKSMMSTLHSSLYWVSYLYVSSNTQRFLKEKQINPQLSPFISGYLGAFASCLITHPLDRLATRKTQDTSFRIFLSGRKEMNKETISFLFKGIFKGHLNRVLIPGLLIEGIFNEIDKTFKDFKSLSP